MFKVEPLNSEQVCPYIQIIDSTSGSPNGSPNGSPDGSPDQSKIKNTWSGYHVQFRDPKNYQSFAIDEKFNRWGEMVEFFQKQDRPYKLSKGSLKDLLYKTYNRKGHHGLSLNDLVTITKIDREKITKNKLNMSDTNLDSISPLSQCNVSSPIK